MSNEISNSMPIYYNDENLYVVDFEAHDALEVVDKTTGQGTVLSGPAADGFKEKLSDVCGDPEEMKEFIESYRGLFQNIRYQ